MRLALRFDRGEKPVSKAVFDRGLVSHALVQELRARIYAGSLRPATRGQADGKAPSVASPKSLLLAALNCVTFSSAGWGSLVWLEDLARAHEVRDLDE